MDDIMDDIQATELLLRRFTGDASPTELAQLDTWLAANEANRALARQMERTWQISRPEEPTLAFDAEAHFAQLMQRNVPQPALEVQRGGRWGRRGWLVAASVALVAAVGWWLLAPTPMVLAETTDEPKAIALPDGSRVWLNCQTRISFPKAFAANLRTVTLVQGDAIFEVQHREQQPFLVETTLGTARDLGTRFWIKIDATALQVAVEEGMVRLQPQQGSQFVDLTKGQKAKYSAAGVIYKRGDVNLNQLAWQRGTLDFVETPLRQVFDDLAEHFQIDAIEMTDAKLADCTFSGKLSATASLQTVLADLAAVYRFRYQVTGKKAVIEGGGCR
jgi:transmembrane sensor